MQLGEMEHSDFSNVAILPEDTIRSLARNGATLVAVKGNDPAQDGAIKAIQDLLECLILTCKSAEISTAHRAAACNLLATLVERCSTSQLGNIQSLLWNQRKWLECFYIFLDQYSNSKPKPIRQLLSVLVSTLSRCQLQPRVGLVKQDVLRLLLESLLNVPQHVPLKPAVLALSQLIVKGVVKGDEMMQSFASIVKSRDQGGPDTVGPKEFITAVLDWAASDDLAPSLGSLLSAVLDCFQKSKRRDNNVDDNQAPSNRACESSLWIEPVLSSISRRPESMENYRHYIFPTLFARSFTGYVDFLNVLDYQKALGAGGEPEGMTSQSLKISEELRKTVVFCALMVGNTLGKVVVREATLSKTIEIGKEELLIPDSVLGKLLMSTTISTRIAGWSLLVSSASITRPFTKGTLGALRRSLPALHADTDANFRSELFGITHRLIDRMRAAAAMLHRQVRSDKSFAPAYNQHRDQFERHKGYLSWYIAFLRIELRPTASYQRHISALKCLEILLRSGLDSGIDQRHWSRSAVGGPVWCFHLGITGLDMTSLLVDLLMDPFDDVRAMSASILRLDMGRGANEDSSMNLAKVLQKAERLSKQSGRADQADGVAHMYRILFDRYSSRLEGQNDWWRSKRGILDHLITEAEKTLKLISTDMALAVAEHPLHGILLSIRYILEQSQAAASDDLSRQDSADWRSLRDRIRKLLPQVWDGVRRILCNDAPEGYLPEELEEEDEGLSTKDVLSYSWRALRESSLLMRVMISKHPVGVSDEALMTVDEFESLGDLCFTQLVELRHRGAFSTVAQTFFACCNRCARLEGRGQGILNLWYERTFDCIRNTTTINTRRSAGLPSLVTGLLAANEANTHLCNRAIQDLTAETLKPIDRNADQSGGLAQIHALNCLKDVFKTSALGERSEPHVPSALELAGNCLSSPIWGIRNAGLMLFRALLDRLLGTNDSYMDDDAPPQSRMSLSRVPNLMNVILRLLSAPFEQDSSDGAITEGVFPALQLLQRAPAPEDRLEEMKNAVVRLTQSPHWHIRDKAARTFATLIPSKGHLKALVELLEQPPRHQDALHGALLSARYLVSRPVARDGQISAQILEIVKESAHACYVQNPCPYTQAAYIDLQKAVLSQAWSSAQRGNEENSPVSTDGFLSPTTELANIIKAQADDWPAGALLRKSLAQTCLYEDSIDRRGLDVLVELASCDVDACLAALEEALTLLKSSASLVNTKGMAVLRVCTKLLGGQYSDPAIEDAARRVLVVLMNSNAGLDRKAIIPYDASVASFHAGHSPLTSDSAMILNGVLLEERLQSINLSDNVLVADLAAWVSALQDAAREERPFDTRMAATQAARRLDNGLAKLASLAVSPTCLLDFYLVIYDLTLDDEDDIRDVAASIACRINNLGDSAATIQDLVPLAAGPQLALYLSKRYRRDPGFVQIAAERLISSIKEDGTFQPATDILKGSSRRDAALFAEEKQNLFIDPAREARIWSHVLINFSTRSLPDVLLAEFSTWTLSGLHALLEKINKEADGSLGWTRNPEVFALGLRIVYAAEAMLRWSAKTRKVHIAGSEIRKKLVALLEAGRRNHINALWLEQIEKILEKAVLRGIMRVGKALRRVDQILG